MNVYDVFAHTQRLAASCRQLPAVDTYIPMASLVEGKWFVLHMPTMTSHTLEDMDNQDAAVIIKRDIVTHEITKELLEACNNIKHGIIETLVGASQADLDAARDKIALRYGASAPLYAAEARAAFSGYSVDEVRLAVIHIAQDPSTEGLATINLADLAESDES